MKLIIDIPESIFNTIQADEMISREQLAILQIHILNGTPLDDVKAELQKIADDSWNMRVGSVSQGLEDAIEILDNIGKTESEDK